MEFRFCVISAMVCCIIFFCFCFRFFGFCFGFTKSDFLHLFYYSMLVCYIKSELSCEMKNECIKFVFENCWPRAPCRPFQLIQKAVSRLIAIANTTTTAATINECAKSKLETQMCMKGKQQQTKKALAKCGRFYTNKLI